MAYASITYTSASGTTFALTNSSGDPIEYLRQADIAVTVNGVLQTQGTDYTFNSAGTAIVLATAVSGATVVISRTTSITDATVSFTAGSTLTAQDLNNSDKQNRFALQEFSDTYGAITTGTGDLSVLGGFIGSAETWVADNAHAATTGAIDGRVDSKIDTALTGDVVAGNAITITDNSPASGQITIAVTDGAIEAAELASNAVTTAKIADGNVTAAKLASDSVTTAKILDANVTTAKIANDAITSAKIADGTIIAGDIAADAITTAKILDANVTTAKIADANITTAKLADSSVTSAKIADGTIVAGDLASDSVTTAKIADSNVTTGKINDSAVTTAKIADSAVTAIKIADGVITSAKLNASTVVTAAEQSGSTPDDTSFFTTSASDGRYVNVTGDTMTGALAMSSNKITGLGTPTANADAVTKQYVDGLVAAATLADADYGDITVSGGATVWTIDNGVVTSAKIADGTIVDGDVNASAAIAGTKISSDFGSQTIQTTGVVSHALGTAAAPTLTFTGDTNTGLYSPGADQVAISTNGSGRLFVDASGNVGVGVSTPSQSWTGGSATAQQLRGLSGQITVFRVNEAGGTYGDLQLVSSGSAEVGIYNFANGAMRFGTNSTERLRITSDGKVGVGTSSPSVLLDVYGTGSVLGKFVRNNTGSAGGGITIGNTDRTWTFFGESGLIQLYDNVAAATRAVIDSSGRVGIGTSSPGTNLDIVVGSGTATQKLGSSSVSGGSYLNLHGASASKTWFIGANYNFGGVLEFTQSTVNGGTTPSSTPAMVLSAAGNVGIGVTSPTQALEVAGSIRLNNDLLYADATATRGRIYGDSTGLVVRADTGLALRFHADAGEKARIDTSGRLLVGTSSSFASCQLEIDAAAQSIAARSNNDAASFSRYQAGSNGSFIFLRKSRNATLGSHTIVNNGDSLGGLEISGSDGTSFITSARIAAEVDGTPGTNDMPGRLVFSTTADGASSPTERMRIKQNGIIQGPQIYSNTDATAANVFVLSNGDLGRSTSSIKYKRDVETLEDSYADAILNCRPVWYRSKSENSNPDWGFWGFIAEEVAEIDPRLVHWKTVEVTYDNKGSIVETPCEQEPESVQYDRFVPHLLNLIKRQQQAIKDLQAEVAALKAQ